MKQLLIVLCFLPIIGYSQLNCGEDSDCENLLSFVKRNYNSFEVKNRKKYIPRGIIKELYFVDSSNFKIRNPGARFQESDIVKCKFFPNKRLISYYWYDNIHIIVFEQGGFGMRVRAILLEFNTQRIVHYCIITIYQSRFEVNLLNALNDGNFSSAK